MKAQRAHKLSSKSPANRKQPVRVFVDNEDLGLNRTHLQKHLAGAFLFECMWGGGSMAGFVRTLKSRGVKKVMLVGSVDVGSFEGVSGVRRVEVVDG